MKTIIEFDHKKATQALNYFAQREGSKIGKLKAIKLMWLADRYHIRRFGRPVVNDTYMAMKYGPVGSAVKDIAECSDFLAEEEKDYAVKFLECKDNLVTSISDVDSDVFSQTDLEALKTVYDNYGSIDAMDLVETSHLYPEWSKHQSALENSTREAMSYVDFFDNPTTLENQEISIFNETANELKNSKSIFEDNFKMADFWVQ